MLELKVFDVYSFVWTLAKLLRTTHQPYLILNFNHLKVPPYNPESINIKPVSYNVRIRHDIILHQQTDLPLANNTNTLRYTETAGRQTIFQLP